MVPLLFEIYLNTLCYAVQQLRVPCKAVNCVDDSNFVAEGEGIDGVMARVILLNVSNWCQAHNLSMNVEKTNSIIFNISRQTRTFPESFTFEGTEVAVKDSAGFLDIIVDKRMNWRPHFESLRKRFNSTIYTFLRSGIM